jgi:hypothetical protein
MAASGGDATETNGGKEGIRFLLTPYPNGNMEITADRRSVVRKNNFGPRIVYFDQGLDVDDQMTIIVGKWPAMASDQKLEFGITTCDIEKITKYKTHVKSVCDHDGRPCGGRSLTCKIIRNDLRAGSMIHIIRARDPVLEIIFDDGQFIQVRDPKNIFKKKTAFPFLMLTGDVVCVHIMDNMTAPGKTNLYQHVNSKRSKKKARNKSGDDTDTHTTTSSAASVKSASNQSLADSSLLTSNHSDGSDAEETISLSSNDLFFMATAYPNDTIKIASPYVVRRKSLFPGFVYFNRCLEVGDEINLRVKKVINCKEKFSFKMGFTTCSFESIFSNDCHANMLCEENLCGGQSFLIDVKEFITSSTLKITRHTNKISFRLKNKSLFSRIIDDKFKDEDLRPFLMLCGSADTIHLTVPDEETAEPQTELPEASSSSDSDDSVLDELTAGPPEASGYNSYPSLPNYSHENMITTQNYADVRNESEDEYHYYSRGRDRTPEVAAYVNNYEIPADEPNMDVQLASISTGYRTDYQVTENEESEPSFEYDGSVSQSNFSLMDDELNDDRSQNGEDIVSEDSGAAAAAPIGDRQWFSNDCVLFSDPFITRIGSHADPNYIFSAAMEVNDRIAFRVTEAETGVTSASLRFGITTLNPIRMSVRSLPPNPDNLKKRLDRDLWFLSSEMTRFVGIYDMTFFLRRKGSAIILENDCDSQVSMDLITNIQFDDPVYPFFYMSGRVKSVQFLPPPEPHVEPLCYQNRLRLYLTFIYLQILNKTALKRN